MNASSWKSTVTTNPKTGWIFCGYIALILCMIPVSDFALALDNTIPSSGAVRLTDEERSWLKAYPEKLTLSFNTEFPPIEFISESGSFTGMGADVIARIESLLGIDFLKKPLDDWNEHLAALKRGDCAIAPTIVRTDERKTNTFFTKPYATVPVVIITPRTTSAQITLADLAGQRVGVVSGYATETYLRKRELQDRFELVTVANVSEGLRRTAFGQIDAFVENLAVAAYYIELEGIPNLQCRSDRHHHFPKVASKSEHMLSMLRRLIGEDIDLSWVPARKLWPVKMDPSQVDQILANLCINARDAIAGVGKLTIETGMKTFDSAYCGDHPGFIPGGLPNIVRIINDTGSNLDKILGD